MGRVPLTFRPRAGTPVTTPARSRFAFRYFFFVPVPAAAPTGAESLALFGRHLLPPFRHAALPRPRWRARATKAAEKDLAQDQQAESLPEGDGAHAGDLRQ